MKKVKLFFVLLMPLLLGSCSAIIEKSIAKETVSLIAPGNKDTSTSYSQTFYWSPVTNALQYELQIVSPSFAKIQVYIDTVLTTTRFTYTLSPGRWIWQVRALNGSSETVYSAADTLYITQTSLEAQQVNLSSPANNTYLNSLSALALTWQALAGANKYSLTLNSSANASILDTSLAITSYNLASSNLAEGVYTWNVTGLSGDTAQSIISDTWTFTFDSTPPDTVSRNSPANNYTYASAVTTATLYWVYNPVNLPAYAAPIDHYVLKLNGVPSSSDISVSGSSASATVPVTAGTYTWSVQAVDKAGNTGAYTTSWTFIVP